jgi:phosphohistidine swiveling domain-containing protein
MDPSLILSLNPSQTSLSVAGGKGTNLARLACAGFPVPGGFIVTTHAYRAYVTANDLQALILTTVQSAKTDDPATLATVSEAIRARFAVGTIPPALADALRAAYATMGRPPVAVRSSATAEDLPEMSFAGQQDTFLNVVGEGALLQAVVNCWSSLWTARAIGYRARNDISHQDVALAVVVQEMVQSEASGVLFTANPLNGKRTESVIDATLGLGEALVSGQVEPDHYVVDAINGRILGKTLGAKAVAIHGQADGGTVTVAKDAVERQALPDKAIVELAQQGRRLAGLLGGPQDIEWAWADGQLFVLQSRPITGLYPLPEGIAPDPLQVLISLGAPQGVLGPMTPLGRDVILQAAANLAELFGYHLTRETQRALLVAGERLFANVTPLVRHRRARSLLRTVLSVAEPGTGQALESIWHDPRLTPTNGRIRLRTLWRLARVFLPLAGRIILCLLRPDVERERVQGRADEIVAAFQARGAATTMASAELTETLTELLALFHDAVDVMLRTLLPHYIPRLAAGMSMLRLLNRLAASLPGDAHDALEMTRGLPHNVTTEMDLTLWATACAVKADPASAARFRGSDAPTLAADYATGQLPDAAQRAIEGFMRRYGVRGVAEIDLGRPRWREDPTSIMQVLQSYLHIENADQAPDVVFERGAASAEEAIEQLTKAVRQTRGGWLKARLVRWSARRMRALAGLREAPKFFIVRLSGILREGLLWSGRALAEADVLAQPKDIFFLHLSELQALAAGETKEWQRLISERRQVYAREERRRQVPRLLLSDGQAFFEGIAAPVEGDKETIVGSPVSPGVVEGVVHVVLDPRGAQLAAGEILVCPATDPAWTPLFLAAGGLVMEVGGLMTHGSVVAREYGIPAVVGVHQATTRLKTGQRVRVDGSAGQIVVLE